MTGLASKDIQNNAILWAVTCKVWYISADISEERAIYSLQERGYFKINISTGSHSIISQRTVHHSHHCKKLKSCKDILMHFFHTGYDDRPQCLLLSL